MNNNENENENTSEKEEVVIPENLYISKLSDETFLDWEKIDIKEVVVAIKSKIDNRFAIEKNEYDQSVSASLSGIIELLNLRG